MIMVCMHTNIKKEIVRMNKQDLVDFMNRFPNMQLATVDQDGQPRTRGMFMYLADEEGIVFHTGSFKKLYNELTANPLVEASFFDVQNMIQVRAAGAAEEIHDAEFRDRIVSSPGREFLKPMIAARGIESIRVFRITGCRVTEWSFASNFTYPKPEVLF